MEVLYQWSRIKQDLSGKFFFVLPYRKLKEIALSHNFDLWSIFLVLIPFRAPLLILADNSCNDRGTVQYNRIHTASRPNFEVTEVRGLFAIEYYGSKSVHEPNAEDMYERWLCVISKDNGASSSAKRRNFAALLRKIMSEAQSKY